jgi:hypothetical protein
MPWIRAQIHFVMPFRDIKSLGQLARAGTKAMDAVDSPARPHQAKAPKWLKRSN